MGGFSDLYTSLWNVNDDLITISYLGWLPKVKSKIIYLEQVILLDILDGKLNMFDGKSLVMKIDVAHLAHCWASGLSLYIYVELLI